MLRYVKGSIFESPSKVLVNTVNTVGAMGKGVAKIFKQVYPDMFKEYQTFCQNNEIEIGKLWLYQTENKWILNFPTKKHWRYPSKIEYIEKGLIEFRERYSEWGIDSISFPPLGCGNGGLDFESQVKPLLEKYLGNLPITILIYPDKSSNFSPEYMKPNKMKKWLRSEPHNLPFDEVWDDIVDISVKNQTIINFYSNDHFHLYVNNKDRILVINQSDNVITIDEINVLDFWNKIKLNGFIHDSNTENIGIQYSYLYSIFKMLNYISMFDYSVDRRGTEIQYHGLRQSPTFRNGMNMELEVGDGISG